MSWDFGKWGGDIPPNRWVVHTLTLLGAKKAIESGITHVICEGDAPFVI